MVVTIVIYYYTVNNLNPLVRVWAGGVFFRCLALLILLKTPTCIKNPNLKGTTLSQWNFHITGKSDMVEIPALFKPVSA